MFGTFQPEEEEPVYGITKPLRSWNPLWANVHVFVDIARDARRATGWRDRWMYVFGPPGWRAGGGGRPRARRRRSTAATAETWDPVVPPGLAAYGFAQFVVALAASFLLLLNAGAHAAAARGRRGLLRGREPGRRGRRLRVREVGGAHGDGAAGGAGRRGRRPRRDGRDPAARWRAGAAAFCVLSIAWFLPSAPRLRKPSSRR